MNNSITPLHHAVGKALDEYLNLVLDATDVHQMLNRMEATSNLSDMDLEDAVNLVKGVTIEATYLFDEIEDLYA